MHIAFVLPDFDEKKNSFSKLLQPILLGLSRQGHEFTIFSGNPSYQGVYAEFHRAVPTIRTPLHFLNVLWFLVAATIYVALWRRNWPKALVHNLGGGSCLSFDVVTAHASHFAWVKRKFEYGEHLFVFFNPLHWIILLLEAWNYRNGKTPVIAVSDSVRKQISHYHPSQSKFIYLIANGYAQSLAASRAQQSAKRSRFTICIASNNHKHKGVAELIGALAIAKNHGEDWTLEVFGVDPGQEHFEKLAFRRGLSNAVVFRGHVDDIVSEIGGCHLYCAPSKYESFGMAYLDAAMAMVPCLATPDGVYQELIENIENIAEMQPLSHPVDANAVYESILSIKRNPDLQAKMVEAFRAKVALYDEVDMANKTIELYENIFSARSGNRGH